MNEELTCKECVLRVGKCCKNGDIVADFMKSNFKDSVIGLKDTVTDYFRPACKDYRTE